MVGTPKRPVGKSVQTTVVKTDKEGLKRELDSMKKDLLAELAKILGEVQAAQIMGYQLSPDGQPIELDNTPVFIPETIGTGKNIEAEINIESKESNSDGLDDATKALKEMKRKKKESKND